MVAKNTFKCKQNKSITNCFRWKKQQQQLTDRKSVKNTNDC